MTIMAPPADPADNGSVLLTNPAGQTRVVETAKIAEVEYQVADTDRAVPRIVPVVAMPDGRNLTTSPLEVTEAMSFVDGVPVAVTRTVVDDRRIEFVAGDTRFTMAARGVDGQELEVDSTGSIRLQHNNSIGVDGDGFAGGTQVEVWLFSMPTFLGHALVDADGNFSSTFEIPDYITLGDHTIQLNGIDASQQVRSTSLHVTVEEAPEVAASSAGLTGSAGGVSGGGDSPESGAVGERTAGDSVGDGGGLSVWLMLALVLVVVAAAAAVARGVARSAARAAAHGAGSL
jgi:hypothetical protein